MSDEALVRAEISFALYLIRAGRLEAAQDALQALGTNAGPSALPAFNELGGAFFDGGRYRQAETVFLTVLQQAPHDMEAMMGLGYALFNQNRLSESERWFRQATALPEAPVAAWRALAAAHLNLHDEAQAMDDLRQALATAPGDAESHALKGLLVYRKSKADLRWRDWTRLNLVDPKGRPNHLSGAVSPAELDEALESLVLARQIEPRIRTDEMGARLLVASGRPEAGLDFLAASPAPDGRSWQLMADIAWLLRDETGAKAYFRKSLEARCQAQPEPRPLGDEASCIARVARGLDLHAQLPPAPTPLVWVHWDAPDYFALSIASALAASPATPLVVLGDSTNAYQPCRHLALTRRADSAYDFLERYRHASENDFAYEAFCFLRWFILRDWAEVEGVERLAAIDSDVLLFADLERDLAPRLNGCDFAFAGPTGPHLTLLTRAGLQDLCDFYMTAYAQGVPDIGGQVSDMTLLPTFLKNRSWADLSREVDGARVDMNMRLPENFVMAGGLKAIRFQGGSAMAEPCGGGDGVRLLALHFQGPAKPHMGQALRMESFTS
ncbi:MAG: tetratricopeptide repeat protein [Rhodospirillales bacterium]|nr:tetratricopeptide repeat protein [Rhodospirillales bacterium]